MLMAVVKNKWRIAGESVTSNNGQYILQALRSIHIYLDTCLQKVFLSFGSKEKLGTWPMKPKIWTDIGCSKLFFTICDANLQHWHLSLIILWICSLWGILLLLCHGSDEVNTCFAFFRIMKGRQHYIMVRRPLVFILAVGKTLHCHDYVVCICPPFMYST